MVQNSEETKFHYKKRIKYFFDYLQLPGADVEEQRLVFINNAKADPEQSYVE